MDTASLKYAKIEVVQDHVLVVTLNRPQAMNSLNWEVCTFWGRAPRSCYITG